MIRLVLLSNPTVLINFPKAIYEKEDLNIFKHTKNTNWTVDFRWDIFDHLRSLFWKETISEVIYDNHRIYDKFHNQEFAGVVLDGLSKWSYYYGFPDKDKEGYQHIRFFNQEFDYYRYPIKKARNSTIFYKYVYNAQDRRIGGGVKRKAYLKILKIEILPIKIYLYCKQKIKNSPNCTPLINKKKEWRVLLPRTLLSSQRQRRIRGTTLGLSRSRFPRNPPS